MENDIMVDLLCEQMVWLAHIQFIIEDNHGSQTASKYLMTLKMQILYVWMDVCAAHISKCNKLKQKSANLSLHFFIIIYIRFDSGFTRMDMRCKKISSTIFAYYSILAHIKRQLYIKRKIY